MAEEVVVATGEASPEPLDHKRKLADLDNEAPDENHVDANEESGAADDTEVSASDESEAKRPRLEEPEEIASENGHHVEEPEELTKEGDKLSSEEETEQPASEELAKEDDKLSSEGDTEQPASVEMAKEDDTLLTEEDTEQPVSVVPVEEVPLKEETEQPTAEPHESGDAQDSAEISQEDKTQELSKEENQVPEQEAVLPLQDDASNAEQDHSLSVPETTAYRMEVPNSKVGVLIGKAGDTIRYLQYNSGAKIQIRRDSDADPSRLTRPVDIVGTTENIKKAEDLINAVIAEADAGGSPSLIAKGLTSSHSTATAEQIQMQVPNEKVGFIIGRGGETIKSLQTRSGARIQLIPQNLPEGDESKERTVRITGDKKQIEIATNMIKEVMNQTARPSPHSTGFNQQAHRPRGPGGGPTQWGQRGPHPSHPTSYDYPYRGPYPSHNAQYQHSSYGNYPQQMGGPRSSYNSGWEQRPPPNMQQQGPPPSSGGYDYYGGRSHYSDAPPSHFPGAHAPGPSPAPAHGPPQTQSNYYSQQQSQGYGHAAPYSQAAPHQSYSHGYEQKYEHHAPAQNPYGGHGSAQQPYPQAGAQQSYPGQQQYEKPPTYGAPAQAPPPQSYGPPRVGQPGEPYQGGTAPASYAQNMQQPQQTYQYPTGGSTQQYPPYGTVPDGYNQAPPASASYPQQQGAQTGYGQPGVQQPSAYGQQVAPAAAYGQYPTSQQGYPEQAAANAAGYAAYQAPQDPAAAYNSAQATGAAAYNSAQATGAAAYTAPASGQPGYAQQTATQTGYAQQTTTQPSYDQSIPQPGYGSVPPSSAPVGSGAPQPQPQPQPGYVQYDSSQVYGPSR